MYGSMRGLPRIPNYDTALRHWEGVVPIRGRAIDTRPLGDRRKTNMLIERTTVDNVDAVACRLYNTNVVTFVADGRIVIDNSWASQSTNQFATQILGGTAYMHVRDGETWVHTQSGVWLVGTELVLRRNPNNRGVSPVSPHTYYVHVLDRKKFNQVKAAYVPFIKHLRNVAKMAEGEGASSYYHGDALQIAADQTREGWGPLMSYLFGVSTRRVWRVWNGGWVNVFNIERGVRWLTDQIKMQYADEVFKKEPVLMGHYKADSNKRYIL